LSYRLRINQQPSDDVRTAIRPHRTASNSKLRVRALPRIAGIEACVGGLDPSFRSRASGNERCFVRKRIASFVPPVKNYFGRRETPGQTIDFVGASECGTGAISSRELAGTGAFLAMLHPCLAALVREQALSITGKCQGLEPSLACPVPDIKLKVRAAGGILVRKRTAQCASSTTSGTSAQAGDGRLISPDLRLVVQNRIQQ
jgi:hypothetical protein